MVYLEQEFTVGSMLNSFFHKRILGEWRAYQIFANILWRFLRRMVAKAARTVNM